MPKLSFIIPIFHTEHILDRCIQHLLDQSLKDFEVIFILDGSSEQAREIIRTKFRNSQIENKILEIEHGGACKARNAGAKEAKGEYWVFWDSDCLIEPGTAKLWIDTFEKKQDIDFIYSDYRFLNEMGAIKAERFDPWLLKVNNYISTCFPFRAHLFPGWDESLESLQDWDFWLSIVEKGGKGYYIQGYAFATEFPTLKSISGRGCTRENWLERIGKVRTKHNIPDKKVCVTSVQCKYDGIRLAKLIDADFRQEPNFKPHKYETIIQVGFSVRRDIVERHADIFSARNNESVKKKIIFWTSDNILDVYRSCNFEAIDAYSKLLNSMAIQYVEDKKAEMMMRRAGFEVSVLPLPIVLESQIEALPDQPIFAVDVEDGYGQILGIIDRSLPDIKLEILSGTKPLKDYTGLINFFTDRTMSESIKRTILNGRHVISNVQQPFCGYVDDKGSKETFIIEVVKKVRTIIDKNVPNQTAVDYYKKRLGPEKLLQVIS